jgi:hypothetical protein
VTRADDVRTWLQRSWWVIFPCFAVLVGRLAIERTCGNPNDLLPATANPAWAWPIAIVYVLGHVWIAGAYLLTANRSHRLVPPASAWTSEWGTSAATIVLMLVVVAVECAPVGLWSFVGTSAGCR